MGRIGIFKTLCIAILTIMLTGCVNPLTIPPQFMTALYNADTSRERARQTVTSIGILMDCVSAQNSSSSTSNSRCGTVQLTFQPGPVAASPGLSALLGGLTPILATITPAQAKILEGVFGDALDQAKAVNKKTNDVLMTARDDLVALDKNSQDSLAAALVAEDTAKASYANAAAHWNAWITSLILLVDTNRDTIDWPGYISAANNANDVSDDFFRDAETAWSKARTALSDRNQVVAKQVLVTALQDRLATSRRQIDDLSAALTILKPISASANLQAQSLSSNQAGALANAVNATSASFGQIIAQGISQIPFLSAFPIVGQLFQAWFDEFQKQAAADRDRVKKELQSMAWQSWGCITGEDKGAADCGLPTQPAPTQPTPPQPASTQPAPTNPAPKK